MVSIDKEKCIGCGACVKDCFPENLFLENGKAEIKGRCMQCGHCIAVCPVDAVSITNYPQEGIEEYDKEKFDISPDRLLNFIKFRRSVRHYKNKLVEKEKLERILEAGRYTATGSNMQDVSYIVVQENLEEIKPLIWESLYEFALKNINEKDVMGIYAPRWIKMYEDYKKDSKNDILFFEAPVLLVVTAFSPLNGGLASSNIELMANAEGIGVLFTGFIEMALKNSEKVRKILGINKKEIISCMLMGYPDIKFRRTVPRKKAEISWK